PPPAQTVSAGSRFVMDTTTSAGTAPSDAAARYAALLRVSKTLAEHHSIAELFAVLADQLHTVVPFDYLALILHNPRTDEMDLALVGPRAVPNPPRDRVPVSELGPSATVFTAQKALVIPIPSEGQLPEMLAFIRAIGRQVSCWLPLTTAHRRLGVLSFGSCLADTYGPGEIAFMEQVAAHVAVAVDNSINFDRSQRLKRELTIERDRLRLLLDISNLLVDTHDLPSLLKATSDALRSAVKHQRASLVLTDRESHEPTVSLTYDERGGVVQATTADGAGFDAVHDATADTPHDDCHPIVTRLASEAMCRVPLSTARSGTLGALDIVASGADALGPPDVELLAHAAPQIAIAVENAVAFGDMAARYDRLIDEKAYLEDEIRAQGAFGDIIGTSASLRRALAAIKTVAPTDATVLLLGETGTGKELAARAIHEISKRRGGPFIRLSGAATPTTLLESELFGSEKGAFTGAVASRAGRLELADGGTLFLDEVGDLAPEIQPKLLRVLQEREFERLGSTRTRRVDVRIVAATNRDLDAMVESETFREDLFYRLSVFP